MRTAVVKVAVVCLLLAAVSTASAQQTSVTSSANNTTVEAGQNVALNVTLNATDSRYEGPGLNVSLPPGWSTAPSDNDGGTYKSIFDGAELVWLNRGEKNPELYLGPPPNEVSGSYTVTVRGSAVNTTPSPSVRETDTSTVTLTVVGNEVPASDFSYTPSSPSVTDPVSFDATQSNDPDGVIVSYDWEFGDGSTGTGETATHTYSTPDVHTVNLTVTDDNGATETFSQTVTVSGTLPVFNGVTGGGERAGTGITDDAGVEETQDTDDTDQTGEETTTGETTTETETGPQESTGPADEPEFELSTSLSETEVTLPSDSQFEGTATVIEDTNPQAETSVTVESEVENVGDASGTTVADLIVDGDVADSKQVTLGPEESTTVSFVLVFGEPGEYEVRVGNSTPENVTVSPPENETGTVAVFLALLIAILLIALVAVLYRRREE